MRPDPLIAAVRGSRRGALVLLLALSTLPAGAASVPAPSSARAEPPVGNLDVRVNGKAALKDVLAGRQGQGLDLRRASAQAAAVRQARGEAMTRLAAIAPGAEVRFSAASGGAELVGSRRGALSAAAPGRSGVAIVRDFLRTHHALFGLADADLADLRFKGESVSRKSGLRMVRLEQVVAGVPVFQTDTRVILDREGRILRVVGHLVPAAAAAAAEAVTAVGAPRVTPQQALVIAMKSVGIDLAAVTVRSESASPATGRLALRTGDPRIRGTVDSRLVYFPLAPGVLVPAWQQLSLTKGPGDWATVVDAGTGVLLWRKNLRSNASTEDARFSVYVQADGVTPTEGPAPHSPTDLAPGTTEQFPTIPRTTVSMLAVQDPVASPDGWISDGGTTTTGNNTDTYLDTDADNAPDAGLLDNDGRPVGNLDGSGRNRDFLGTGYSYSPPPVAGDPNDGSDPSDPQYQRGMVTQLFYLTNWFHDRLYQLGFDEAAGNFQSDNFGRGGADDDAVLGEAQDGIAANNASFATLPDGSPGLMQMSLFTFPTLPRDGSFDAAIVLHELTHGVTSRMLGDATGMLWDVGGSLGEGWSDFYALSLLFNGDAYPPDASYAFANYALYAYRGRFHNYLYGFRRFPYSSEKSVNPLTFGDIDDVTLNLSGGIAPSLILWSRFGGLEVHNAGEIWANTLWDVRNRIISDPEGANGDVPTGGEATLQLVTDALRFTPSNPSFVDARDALFEADCATNGCANETSIWGGFANRGLGYKAVAPLAQDGVNFSGAYMGIGESFDLPYLDIDGWTINDTFGNNNGAIDPGEPIHLTVDLLNPWRAESRGVAVATATLSTATAGVTLFNANATWPAILPQETATGTPFVFSVPAAALCGQSIHFTLTVTSALGTKSVDFTLRVGNRTGTGAPVTYAQKIPGGLPILDNDLRGVRNVINIPDDFEIADLDLRVDDLTHTFTSDILVGLRAPTGYGTSLIFRRGLFVPDGDGDDFLNTVIDGESANDLNQSAATAAPYTDDWLPAFNSPIWGLFGFPNFGPDPVDQLSHVDGQSTQGAWTIQVADEAVGETGQLNGWSLIVTPTAFTCAAVPQQAAVSGTKTASGNFVPGGPITYTITLRNQGTTAQADNPGDEFTDELPAALTLVSATATAGTAVADIPTNTVTWNGPLAAVAGEVTITINATVKNTAGGQTVANQGTFSFDANNDGTNESTGVTDDPTTAAAGDPTAVAIAQTVIEVPTLSPAGFAALGLLLGGAGLLLLRRRRSARP